MPAREWVAIILAIGLALAVNLITVLALVEAIKASSPGLTDNGTQVLTMAFGGMIGVLGSYVGSRFGRGRSPGEGDED